ncbi:putative leucine-rich repeat receptor-like protein kinase At2g19210 [Pistacia vera]|uniref:putative leucine-rich repeat receptor-like protein kinase At2g19210 n=1 Tax=Pistacia vera TaxID=55513 RepID=UPI001263797A|nr:putative leucine-rich repeat receptor-like protein kinase At2g19210 [Pistacia vera]
MKGLRTFHHALLAGFTLAVLIHAEDQSGFISIDCGIPEGSGYDDEKTGVKYISDVNFTDGGINRSILSEFQTSDLERQFYNVRSFPEGIRNCYTIYPAQGKNNRYLIRARFMYGNCDNQNSVPQFDLYLAVDLWQTVALSLEDHSGSVTAEIIHVLSTSYIFVCLVNTGRGTPFISSLELRLLDSAIHTTASLSDSLLLQGRYDFCSTTNQSVRYKDDKYDRIWMPINFPDWETLSQTFPVDAQVLNATPFQPPTVVMGSACTPTNDSEAMFLNWDYSNDSTSQYYFYIHFAEVQLLGNQIREFNIYLNGNLAYGPVTHKLLPRTVFTPSPVTQGTGSVWLKLNKTETSDLPPIMNAIEIYMVKQFSQLQTDQNDVRAIINIKSTYGVKRNWQGDPCAPKVYWWDGLNCSYENSYSPRIVSLNMSSSGLTGEISLHFAELTLLQSLDLSDNSLSGTIPEVLSRLPSLRNLNLKRNNLRGSLPDELRERWNRGLLTLSVDENPNICLSASCEKTKNKYVVPVIASLATFSAFLIALAIFFSLKTRKKSVIGEMETELKDRNDSFESRNRQFTYSDVLSITKNEVMWHSDDTTKNFYRVLGKGGFGTVYYGFLDENYRYLDHTEVAVKMLSPSSVQGYKEFHAEIKLLMRVHHKNLTTLIGYCMEGTYMGLVYEYMAVGNLENYLSGKDGYILSWEDRLRIAMNAAQGLEYLHYGCKPPIVHRDVKPANILLNEKLEAKMADFGLSRIFPTESGTNIMTEDLAGTPGYIDPECSMYNRMNEKSDVYSFGVVLLKIISNRAVIAKISQQNVHISEWVQSKLAEADIRNIVDPHLGDDFNTSSAWKAVELALACASNTSSERPTMTEVVMGLKECFAVEIARNDEGRYTLDNVNLDSEFSPQAR